MADDRIQFVRNYRDLSTDQGFQFEFDCDRCGSGCQTRFKQSAASAVSSVLDAAGGLFGGILGSAANIGERVKSAAWEKAHDNAFAEAVTECKQDFTKCPRCSKWVCKSCWNDKRGLCKECAPDLGVEMSAAQASKSVEEIWAHAAMAEEDKHLALKDWRTTIVASCPECGEPQETNAAFCAKCGAKLKQGLKCPSCETILSPTAKFCPGCGAKVPQEGACAGCGAELAPEAKFCPECGQKTGS